MTIGGRTLRLKAGGGIKNLVVSASWSTSIVLSVDPFSLPILVLFLFKLLTNSAAFDIADREEDEILTLPKIFGRYTPAFLTATNSAGHAVAVASFGPHPIIITSFLTTQAAILLGGKSCRRLIDAEPTSTVLLYLSLTSVL